MEFADLMHSYLKDHGISAHVQPHWRTPGWRASYTNDDRARRGEPPIDFGPEVVVRAVTVINSMIRISYRN